MVEIKYNSFHDGNENELTGLCFDMNSIVSFGKFLCAMSNTDDLVLHGVHEDGTENCFRIKVEGAKDDINNDIVDNNNSEDEIAHSGQDDEYQAEIG